MKKIEREERVGNSSDLIPSVHYLMKVASKIERREKRLTCNEGKEEVMERLRRCLSLSLSLSRMLENLVGLIQ